MRIALTRLAVLAVGSLTPDPAAGQSSIRPIEPPGQEGESAVAPGRPGRFVGRIQADGYRWWYHVHVPAVYDGRRPLPLVFVFHGSGGSGRGYLDQAGWADQAEREGFLVVAPDGLAARPGLEPNYLFNPRLWNSGQHDPLQRRSRVDDVALFDALLDEVGRRWRIDPRRVYVTGHSNGAALAYRLAAERADRIAAIAPVAGVCWVADPRPARPVPTLFLAGTSDPILPFGGGLSVLPWGVRTTPPVSQGLTLWARALGCAPEPSATRTDAGVVVQDYAAAPDDIRLRAIFIEGQGHGWPGTDAPLMERVFLGPNVATINATDLIWRFFRRHHLSEPEPAAAVARRVPDPPPAPARTATRDPWRAPASRMAQSGAVD